MSMILRTETIGKSVRAPSAGAEAGVPGTKKEDNTGYARIRPFMLCAFGPGANRRVAALPSRVWHTNLCQGRLKQGSDVGRVQDIFYRIRTTSQMRYIRTALTVAIIWLLISGHYSVLILSLGALSVLTVTWLFRRMDRVDGQIAVLPMRPRLLYYLLWLMWQIVLSNIDLVRRIWDPSLPIRPTWQRLDIKVTSSLAKMLYANSITLTPGTLTTDVKEDHFMVHSLTPDGIDELRKGDMEKQIQRLGI